MHTSAKAVLPVYRTTPTAALIRESGIPPAEIALNKRALMASARLQRLDPRHPLVSRAQRIRATEQSTSRFARRVLALPPAEQTNPLAAAPWTKEARQIKAQRIGAPQGASKEFCSKAFLELIAKIPPRDIVLYSDGSKLKNQSTGAGFVAYQYNIQVLYQTIPLGTRKEVFDAEAIGALEGLKAALKLPSTKLAENLWICLDNLEVAMQLLDSFDGSSQAVFESFKILAKQWQLRTRLLHIPIGSVKVHWVPGHTKIKGNEVADKAAKEGAGKIPAIAQETYSVASLQRWARQQESQAMHKLWLTVAPSTYQNLGVHSSPINPGELKLPRFFLGKILAARTGHGDFAEYHERFGHQEAYLYCSCGTKKGPIHFAFCSRAKRRARLPSRSRTPGEALEELLGTSAGAAALAKWFKKTGFFVDICPRDMSVV